MLTPEQEKRQTNKTSISIANTQGDVIGAGASGSANITGKDIGYTLKGNVMNVHVNTLSNDDLEFLQGLMTTVPTEVKPHTSVHDTANALDEGNIERKLLDITNATQKQIRSILDEVNNIEKASGEKIEEISAGDLQISTDDPLLKDIILKGNEHYYKKEYEEAIKWYDRAIKKDRTKTVVWFNKGFALMRRGKYNDAVSCFDNYLKINPFNASALNNKAYSLAKINKSIEALPVVDKALEINSHNAAILDTKGFILYKLGRYEEALDYFSKSLEREENYTRWKHKGDALHKLGKDKDAEMCYRKSKELKANPK
jgi:tetratricopeptide (TPR) repeat protein